MDVYIGPKIDSPEDCLRTLLSINGDIVEKYAKKMKYMSDLICSWSRFIGLYNDLHQNKSLPKDQDDLKGLIKDFEHVYYEVSNCLFNYDNKFDKDNYRNIYPLRDESRIVINGSNNRTIVDDRSYVYLTISPSDEVLHPKNKSRVIDIIELLEERYEELMDKYNQTN